MGAFRYEALKVDGRAASGVIQADTARSARSLLRERGLTPLIIDALADDGARANGIAKPWWEKLAYRRENLSARELALFARELATLIGAGLPIDEALAALGESRDDARLRTVVVQLRSRVMEGRTLAQAFGDFPDSFPPAFRAAVAAGEASGRLNIALVRLADAAEGRQDLTREVWGALAYPLLLTLVALAVVTGLLAYVVPRIVGLFTQMQQELPLITRALLGIASLVRDYGGLLALLAVGVGIAIALAWRHPIWRGRIDAALLKLPLIGRLTRSANTARAAETLATLTESGVPVLEAMQIAAGTIASQPLQAALRTAALRVREGSGFARALAEVKLFPPVALRLIASGERAGKLDALLAEAARHQRRELEAELKLLTTILAPATILLVGALVLFIVLAIMLPIFELNQLIR